MDFSTFVNENCAVINSIKILRCIWTVFDAIANEFYCGA